MREFLDSFSFFLSLRGDAIFFSLSLDGRTLHILSLSFEDDPSTHLTPRLR